GVSALYHALAAKLAEKGLPMSKGRLPRPAGKVSSAVHPIIPAQRGRYLADIAESVRGYHAFAGKQATLARERQSLEATQGMLGKKLPEIDALLSAKNLDPDSRKLLDSWPKTV